MSNMAIPPLSVCVVGGSGFLGSAIVQELLDRGGRVTVLDVVRPQISSENLTFVSGSLLDSRAVQTALSGASVVYNCGAIADLRDAQKDPIETFRVNLEGTVRLLQQSIAMGVERFVFASSVYASSRHGGFYRISKQAAEASVQELCRGTGTGFTILRYGSLYGPGAPEWNGLRRLVQRAVEDRELRYTGKSDAIREYIHVSDAARVSVDMLAPGYENRLLVVTGLETMRIYDVLMMLGEILALEAIPQFDPLPDRDHYVRTPYAHNPMRAEKLVPNLHVDLAQGLLELVNEIEARRNC